MVDEKKYGFFNPKPKLTVEKLAEKVESDNKLIIDSMEKFSQIQNDRFNQLKDSISNLSQTVESLKETKNIPEEWVKIILKMKEFDSNLPEIPVIYSVLSAYKNLNQNVAKENQQKTIQKLSEKKFDIISRKIHNCSKCGKAVEEGDYFVLGNKQYCLSHKEEPLGEQKMEDNAL